MAEKITINQLVEACRLDNIFLRNSSSELRGNPILVKVLEHHSKPSCSIEWVRNKGELTCFVTVKLEGMAAKAYQEYEVKEGDLLYKVEGVIGVFYKIPDGEYEKQVLDQFTQSTGLFNAFAYLREFFSSMSCRMNIGPITLPLITIGSIMRAAEEKERLTEKKGKGKAKVKGQ